MRAHNILLLFMLLFPVVLLSACEEDVGTEIEQTQGPLLTNAPVPPVTPEGARKIREMFQDNIYTRSIVDGFQRGFKQSISEKNETLLEKNVQVFGSFKVQPRNSFYLVTFPHKTVIHKPENYEGDSGIEKIEIHHDLELEVRPTGDPKAWRVKSKPSPNPLTLKTFAGGQSTDLMSLSLQGQIIDGLWHESFQSFVQNDTSLTDLEFLMTVPEEIRRANPDIVEQFSIKLGALSFEAGLAPDENNLWSGPYKIVFNNVNVAFPDDAGSFKILKTEINQDFQALNPDIFEKFYAAYENILQSIYTQATDQTLIVELPEAGPSETTQHQEHLVTFLKTYKELIERGFRSTESDMSVIGLDLVVVEDKARQENAASLIIDEMQWDGFLKNGPQDLSSLKGAIEFRGIDVESDQGASSIALPQISKDFYPQNFRTAVSVEQLHLINLLDHLIKFMQQAMKAGAGLDTKGMELAQVALQKMEEAGTQFEINNSYIGNDLWLALLNGGGKINTEALYKMVGESELRLYGVDRLLALISAELENPEMPPQTSQVLQNAMAGLSVMQMFGQQKTDEQGSTYRGYTLTITPDGKTELNGTDINQMIGSVKQR